MDHSSQHDMEQPSQEIIDRLPQGYPPVREHLQDANYPIGSDLQQRLAEISKQNLAECPEGSQAGTYYRERKR